jgi:hypothetical protein
MRSILVTTLFCAVFALVALTPSVNADTKPITVTGKLVRVVAAGGETTGWAIELDSPLKIGDESVHPLEVDHDTNRFTKLEDKHVEANGNLTTHTGKEHPQRHVLEVTNIHEANPK